MSTRLISIALTAITIPLSWTACFAQDFRSAVRPLAASADPLSPTVAGQEWVTFNRQRWFWYMPQEWQFPGFLRPPVLISLDTMGPTPTVAPALPTNEPSTTTIDSVRESTQIQRQTRLQPEAFRWNEASGRAEPIEVQRWGGAQGNNADES